MRVGHAVGPSTLSVRRVADDGGFTGRRGRVIYARVEDDVAPAARFRRYEIAKPVSPDFLWPCEGTGDLIFSTCSTRRCPAGARPDIVTVTFRNLGV